MTPLQEGREWEWLVKCGVITKQVKRQTNVQCRGVICVNGVRSSAEKSPSRMLYVERRATGL